MAEGIATPLVELGSPVNPAIFASFTDSHASPDLITGTLTISKATIETDLTHYTIYWGSDSTTKQSSTPITTLAKTGLDLTYNFAAGTSIPATPKAIHLLVYSLNNGVEMLTPVSTAISDLVGASSITRKDTGLPSGYISSVTVHPHQAETVFVTFSSFGGSSTFGKVAMAGKAGHLWIVQGPMPSQISQHTACSLIP